MTDEHGKGAADEAHPTNEERLRALTSDRKRKVRGTVGPGPGDPQRRPGDVVDAVRERTTKDPGKDLTR